MSIFFFCECGRKLTVRDEFAQKQASCPTCGRTISIPHAENADNHQPPDAEHHTEALPITEFLEPPEESETPSQKPSLSIIRRMFEAMLDPRSIHWMLTIGGGLLILGLIILLINWLNIETPYIIAGSMGIGTLAVMAAGWFLTLKTRFQTAGRALTFLGCVLAPLNLWYYHAQGLVTLENHLWIGGAVCSLIYIATVRILKDPLFMYAVEVGVTLTVLLFLSVVNVAVDATTLSMTLLSLALISLHSERAFKTEATEFSRRKYGMPLFWSSQAQTATGLLILLGSQILFWIKEPLLEIAQYQIAFQGNLLTDRPLLAGTLWLVAVYFYLYSDLVVRRVGLYIYGAAFCLLMSVISFIGWQFENLEWLIMTLAVMALGAIWGQNRLREQNSYLTRISSKLGFIFSAVPLLIGFLMLLRSTQLNWPEPVSLGALYVVAMLVVALCNGISCHLMRQQSSEGQTTYLFMSAAAVLLATLGLMPLIGLTLWYQQAPLLMLLPIIYVIGCRIWRGRTIERPLYWIAQSATALILLFVAGNALKLDFNAIRPEQGALPHLMLGMVFAEAAMFYVMAGLFRSRGNNAYFAAVAACGAVWQWLGYAGLTGQFHPLIYAALGLSALGIARYLGINETGIYLSSGKKSRALRGRGLTAFQSGNAIFLITLLSTFWQAVSRLILENNTWTDHGILTLIALLSSIAVAIVPRSHWRYIYSFSAFSMVALTIISISIDWLRMLSLGQRVELISVLSGIAILTGSHIARFREEDKQNDLVDVGLFFGSLLAVMPLFIMVVVHRGVGDTISLHDEIGLIAVTVLMLVTGISWQTKFPTLISALGLVGYLILLLVDLARHAEQMLSMGIFLSILGGLLFLGAIALSIYREKLLALPDKFSNREGIFKIVDWR